MIRVLVADDQAMVRAGLAALLDAEPDLAVVGEAADGVQAVTAVRALRPDVVLMDVRMPELDGLAAARTLLADGAVHRPRIVMLTTFDVDDYVYEALRAGVSGFLLKDATPEVLAEAVRVAAAGDALLAPSITRRMIERFAARRPATRRDAQRLAGLTARERDVLRLIARGLSNAEVAADLVIAEETVKSHVGRLFAKLALRDRAQAVVFAYESGLVEPGR
ncbi:response regulator [Pseudonocardia sichuanensis]|uniref:LuxR family two component transcriptional regulator n=1 Tax=Pseudonocardia kunmingensis TaxID=630975 RepID=A0A543E2D9_9PSEU|nr:response regulator transcription factor [Pseudonocardia kunmingensis]TQM15753.1 LuxR family two component transcriptional regulator [Pseudonocardia kunmingensis]